MNNGADGKLPLLLSEWRVVGIDSDLKAYKLLDFLYTVKQN